MSLILTACGGGGGAGPIASLPPVNMGPGGSGTGGNAGGTGGGQNNNNQINQNLVPQAESSFLTQEYNQTSQHGGHTGLAQINAAKAYATGATGAGIVVGVLDTGIDYDNAEFAGRLSNKSINIVTGSTALAGLEGANEHGTWVAGVVGAAKNNSGTHGVAFNSTIMAIRADTVNPSCPTGCFQVGHLAQGIEYAANNGARVLNMSFGVQGDLGQMMRDAMTYAASRNVLMVAAAGNSGLAQVDSPANFGAVTGIAGSLLAVGAVDQNGQISSFSNRAGTAKNYYLVAPGNMMLTTDTDGMALVAGTSFAAPMVSGAAALLMEYAPYLTAPQVASILLNTATDLGAAGVDDVYGYGLLNVGAALSPVGVTSVPTGGTVQNGGGSGTATTSLALGSAFGDALVDNNALASSIMLDEYGRAFGFDLSQRVVATEYQSNLANFIATPKASTVRSAQLAENTFLTTNFSNNEPANVVEDLADQGKQNGELRMALSTEAAGVELGFTHGYGIAQAFNTTATPNTVEANMFDNAFLGLVQGGNTATGKIDLSDKIAKGLSVTVGAGLQAETTSLTSTAETAGNRSAYVAELAYETKRGAKLGLQLGTVNEGNSTLGSSSDGALAFGNNSRTNFVGVNANIPLMQGLTLAATYQMGFSKLDSAENSLIGDFKGVTSDKFAVALMADDVAQKGDRLTLAVSSPVRVNGGSALLTVPTGVDAEGRIAYAKERVGLTPTGRQLDLQAGYTLALNETDTLGISTVGTLNPGHNADAPMAFAAGVRYTSKF